MPLAPAMSLAHALNRYPTAEPAFRAQLHDLCRRRFPSWEEVASRYLEVATGGSVAPA